MILPDLIGKLLMFVEAIMDNFVSVVTHQTVAANCSPGLTVPVVTLLPCGWSVAYAIAGISETGLTVLNFVFGGLLAVGV
jgi:hypothetical protein